MQTKEYHIKLPKHLTVRMEDAVLDRYGYKAKGGITLLIIEAIEEKLNPSKTKDQKNGLVPLGGYKRINRYVNVVDDISMLLPAILRYRQEEEVGTWFISRPNLEKAIETKTGYTDKRAVKRRIKMLTNAGVLTAWEYYNGKYEKYMINMDKIEGEKPALE